MGSKALALGWPLVPPSKSFAPPVITAPTDADAIAYIVRNPAAPSAERQFYIDRLVKTLKAYNIWPLLDGVVDLTAEAEPATYLNMKGAAGTLTKSGTLVHTPNIGVQGDGSSGYLIGPAPGSNYVKDSASAWIWDNLPDTRTGNFTLGTASGTLRLRARQVTIDAPAGYINDGTADPGTTGSGRLPGLTGANRTAAAEKQIVRDGVDVGTFTTASTTINSQAIWVGRSGSNYSTGQHAFVAWGGGLTAIQRAGLWAAVRDYLIAVQRPIMCFGDSLTWGQVGAGVQAAMPWPALIQSALGRFCFNAGVPGETSTAIRTRQAFDQIGIVATSIIEAGRNNYTNPQTVKGDIAAMVSRINNGRYIVVGVLPWTSDGDLSSANSIVRAQLNADLAALYGSKYLDWWTFLRDANDGSSEDMSDIANGWTPRSLRYDAGHIHDIPNARGLSGIGVVASAIRAKIAALGI